MKFLISFLLIVNAQRYTSLLNRANQKRRAQQNERPMYYGNTYSHEPQRNFNSYGGPSGKFGCFVRKQGVKYE